MSIKNASIDATIELLEGVRNDFDYGYDGDKNVIKRHLSNWGYVRGTEKQVAKSVEYITAEIDKILKKLKVRSDKAAAKAQAKDSE